MDGWMHRYVEGLVDGWTDRYICGWINVRYMSYRVKTGFLQKHVSENIIILDNCL